MVHTHSSYCSAASSHSLTSADICWTGLPCNAAATSRPASTVNQNLGNTSNTLYLLNSAGLKGLNKFWQASKFLWNLQVELDFFSKRQISLKWPYENVNWWLKCTQESKLHCFTVFIITEFFFCSITFCETTQLSLHLAHTLIFKLLGSLSMLWIHCTISFFLPLDNLWRTIEQLLSNLKDTAKRGRLGALHYYVF